MECFTTENGTTQHGATRPPIQFMDNGLTAQQNKKLGACPLGGRKIGKTSVTAHTKKSTKHHTQFFTRIIGTHEGFADKEGVYLVCPHQGDIRSGENTAFGDDDTFCGNARQQV